MPYRPFHLRFAARLLPLITPCSIPNTTTRSKQLDIPHASFDPTFIPHPPRIHPVPQSGQPSPIPCLALHLPHTHPAPQNSQALPPRCEAVFRIKRAASSRRRRTAHPQNSEAAFTSSTIQFQQTFLKTEKQSSQTGV